MKKLITLLTIIIFTFGHQTTAADGVNDDIIQTLLDVKLMDDELRKEQSNVDEGVLIIDLANSDTPISASKFDKPVQLIEGPEEANGRPYIMINDLTIKKEQKAVLKGTYDGSKLKFKCKKTDDGWMFTHLSLKGNGRSVFEVEF
ncbi:MAG: hypothetical protein AAGA18_15635 [Verrucomicrobiota bacterium]